VLLCNHLAKRLQEIIGESLCSPFTEACFGTLAELPVPADATGVVLTSPLFLACSILESMLDAWICADSLVEASAAKLIGACHLSDTTRKASTTHTRET
jgi:hypothetical protein